MKISRLDIELKKQEIFSTSDKIEVQMMRFFSWLQENESNLDFEANIYFDTLLAKFSSVAIGNIENEPDSIRKRKALRKAANVGNVHFNASNFLVGIERAPLDQDDVFKAWSTSMLNIHQSILDLLFDVVHLSSKEKQPVLHLALCYSCFDELTAALHLARHHYYIQASNHLRTVLETIERMDLFRRFPETVEVWAGSDTKRILKELRPSEVRKKLGKDKYDRLYSYLSEIGTHPTFDMFKARAGIDVSDSSKARIVVGGTPFEHLRLFYYPISLLVASSLFGSVMRSFEGVHLIEECVEMSKERINDMKDFMTLYFLPKVPSDSGLKDELIAVFDTYIASLDDNSSDIEVVTSDSLIKD